MIEHAKQLETRACGALVSLAGTCAADVTTTARNMCANALRQWRKIGRRDRAVWFRRHISFVGYPFTPAQLAGSNNRAAAWRRRYYRNNPLLSPQGAPALED